MLIFFAKTLDLQILRNDEFSVKAQQNKSRIYQIRPARGVIYDSNLKQLAQNKPSFDLVLDKRDFLQQDKLEQISALKEISGIIEDSDIQDLYEKIEQSKSTIVLIYENLCHSRLILFETIIKDKDEFSGFKIEQNTVREYVDGPSFSHLIGYTGKISADELEKYKDYSTIDYIGKTGIEKSYEKILRGESGELEIEKNVREEKIQEFIKKEPKTGESITLYLDSELQQKIEQELKKQLDSMGSKKAAAVAINPKNGGVLAMVSWPNYDNNLFAQGISQEELDEIQNNELNPLFNRVVSGQYLTGSTIKPLIAAAGLQEEIITPEKNINCTGKIVIENPWYDEENPDTGRKEQAYTDHAIHGLTNLTKAIAQSCNIYFYTLGGGYENFKGLGAGKIKKYLELFGWGSKTEIALPYEQSGFIPTPEWKEETEGTSWTVGNTYHFSIGQGYVQATPLQVAVSYSAIANKGILYKPLLVQGAELSIVRENFIDAENLDVVRQGMREAVIYGSAKILNDLPFETAAKTGTAQTNDPDIYHNWVTVFAPYDDPEIVLTFVIEDVEGVQSAVLPVAKEVLKWYFQE
jgi:penicillin-binding protein 2